MELFRAFLLDGEVAFSLVGAARCVGAFSLAG